MNKLHMQRNAIGTVMMGFVVIGLQSMPARGQATFQGLGDLPGGSFHSEANGVSADGSVVVGFSKGASGFEAFRWTRRNGMISLGDQTGGIFSSRAFAVSADGSVVVGRGQIDLGTLGIEAFMWTSEGGMVGLGELPGGRSDSTAFGVSADGSVVIGNSLSALGFEAFRWTKGKGMVALGDLPGGNFGSTAWSASADGSVLVGFGRGELGSEAFRWTRRDGMISLGDLPGGIFSSRAFAVSADGSVVVGRGQSDLGTLGIEAFMWTSEGGMVGLGALRGTILRSEAYGLSADGSVVVGSSVGIAGGFTAFMWDAVHGMRDLKVCLETKHELDLTGWRLWRASAISADGQTIIGWGRNPEGHTEAWRATLPAPPCPTDLNDDGIVDVLDLLQVVYALRTRGDVPEDLDGDSVVTPRDMHIVIGNFGPCDGSPPALNKPLRIREQEHRFERPIDKRK